MEENKSEYVVLRKLHLDSFIRVLVDLYESGVDYIDLCGKNNEEQDVVDIRFTKDYTVYKNLSEDEAMGFVKDSFNNIEIEREEQEKEEEESQQKKQREEPPPTTKYKLSDDDLNQLL